MAAMMIDGHKEVLDMLESRVNEDHFGEKQGRGDAREGQRPG